MQKSTLKRGRSGESSPLLLSEISSCGGIVVFSTRSFPSVSGAAYNGHGICLILSSRMNVPQPGTWRAGAVMTSGPARSRLIKFAYQPRA